MENRLKIIIAVIVLTGSFITAFISSQNQNIDKPLAIGEKAPLTEVGMQNISSSEITLKQAVKSQGLLVIFSSCTCPWVARWEGRYNPVAKLAKTNKIGVVALNANASYRNRGESMADMKKQADEGNYQFDYALDKQSKLAKAFGATHTPHIFLFDGDMKLVYRGAIDDNAQSAAGVDHAYLKNAIRDLATGKKIEHQTTKSLGCTIKFPD